MAVAPRLAVPALLIAATAGAGRAEDWNRFRGPNGSGIAADGVYPERLTASNLVWKSPARPGKSSPVLTAGRVFLTAFEDDKLFTQCFDRLTGTLLWERVEPRSRVALLNQLNEPAATSPVTDGDNVYVLFRDVGLISYSASGAVRWKTPLDPLANIMGHSSSPIIAGDSLILQADQSYDSFLAAYDLSNGEIRWKQHREEREGWTTPLIYSPEGSPAQILTVTRGSAAGHRLEDGRRLWTLTTLPPAMVASPTLSADTVYAFGYGNEPDSDFEGRFRRFDRDGDGLLTSEEFGRSALFRGVAHFYGNRDGVSYASRAAIQRSGDHRALEPRRVPL